MGVLKKEEAILLKEIFCITIIEDDYVEKTAQ